MSQIEGFSFERLLRAAVQNAGENSVTRRPRWAHVRDLLMIGGKTAHLVCDAFGVDPDEQVSGAITCTHCSDPVAYADVHELEAWCGKCEKQ